MSCYRSVHVIAGISLKKLGLDAVVCAEVLLPSETDLQALQESESVRFTFLSINDEPHVAADTLGKVIDLTADPSMVAINFQPDNVLNLFEVLVTILGKRIVEEVCHDVQLQPVRVSDCSG